MIKILKKYKILFLVLLIEAVLFFVKPELSKQAWLNSFHFSFDVFIILPPVLLLMGLLDVWLPRCVIESYLGKKSGIKGMLMATLLGSAAAGPLFTAFPIAESLSKKGSRTTNIVIFLSSWATIKIPMLMMESRFLGLKFSLLRLTLTFPFIIAMGVLIEKLSPLNKNYICDLQKMKSSLSCHE